jgi:hypothetical protein
MGSRRKKQRWAKRRRKAYPPVQCFPFQRSASFTADVENGDALPTARQSEAEGQATPDKVFRSMLVPDGCGVRTCDHLLPLKRSALFRTAVPLLLK